MSAFQSVTEPQCCVPVENLNNHARIQRPTNRVQLQDSHSSKHATFEQNKNVPSPSKLALETKVLSLEALTQTEVVESNKIACAI